MKPDLPSMGNMLSISDDGYIRLQLSELRAVDMRHLISGLDENMPEARSGCGLPTTISGYTEWISDTMPVITIGWDWQMQSSTHLLRLGEPRSNLILLDGRRMDIDCIKNSALLEEFVDTLGWQTVVMGQIAIRYSWQ